MAKFPTFPTLFDDVLQLSTTKLKEWKYLEPGQSKSGVLTWSRNENKTGSISIMVNMDLEQPYIVLDYKYKDEPRNYKVELVSISSNLGVGKIWYFLCPLTFKRCRKLYSIDGYFLHRDAFRGCMYESQTASKQYRWIDKNYGSYFRLEKLYDELYSKHFKKYYAGKPTKRYLKIINEIKKAESISYTEIEKLYLN